MKALSAIRSTRDSIGAWLRDNKIAIALELALISFLRWRDVYLFPVGFWTTIMAIGFISLWLRNANWNYLGCKRPDSWKKELLRGIKIAGFALLLLPIGAIAYVRLIRHPFTIDLSFLNNLRGNVPGLLIYIPYQLVEAALAEEIAYRGYLLNRFLDLFGHNKGGWALSICLSAIIFGVGHRYQGSAGMYLASLAGVGSASVYLLLDRDLWPLIIAHATINTVVFIAVFANLDIWAIHLLNLFN